MKIDTLNTNLMNTPEYLFPKNEIEDTYVVLINFLVAANEVMEHHLVSDGVVLYQALKDLTLALSHELFDLHVERKPSEEVSQKDDKSNIIAERFVDAFNEVIHNAIEEGMGAKNISKAIDEFGINVATSFQIFKPCEDAHEEKKNEN